MAFVDIPKPEGTPQVATAQAISATASMPTAQIIKVSLWVPPYFAETLDETLQDPLKALFVSDATTANVKLEVGLTKPG